MHVAGQPRETFPKFFPDSSCDSHFDLKYSFYQPEIENAIFRKLQDWIQVTGVGFYVVYVVMLHWQYLEMVKKCQIEKLNRIKHTFSTQCFVLFDEIGGYQKGTSIYPIMQKHHLSSTITQQVHFAQQNISLISILKHWFFSFFQTIAVCTNAGDCDCKLKQKPSVVISAKIAVEIKTKRLSCEMLKKWWKLKLMKVELIRFDLTIKCWLKWLFSLLTLSHLINNFLYIYFVTFVKVLKILFEYCFGFLDSVLILIMAKWRFSTPKQSVSHCVIFR